MASLPNESQLNKIAVSDALSKEIGRGAHSRVFTVEYMGLKRAAKEIHAILLVGLSTEEYTAIKDRFIRECYQTSLFRHRNIVQFIGVYYSKRNDLPIMVMELLDTNLTLFVEKNKSNMYIEIKLSILHDVSVGLSYLHGHDPPVVHCNLSPNNVLLTNDPRPVAKISNLGMAEMIRADSKKESRLTTCPGSPHFMPPETLTNDPEYGIPVDVFSFAGIALHLFSEEWPIPIGEKQRDPKTKTIVLVNEIQRRQRYLDKMVGGAAPLRETVVQCLDNDPDKRPLIQEVSKKIETIKRASELQSFGKFSTPFSNSIPDPSTSTKALFCEYLDLLGLTRNFPKKLTIGDAMVIRKETLGNIADIDQIKVLPYLILQKIMMFDSRSRASLYTGEIPENPILADIDEIHPLDSFIALLQCCDNFVTQEILAKMSTCQLAIPFLLPNPHDGNVMYLLWGMRGIIQAWKSTKENNKMISNECHIVDYPGPIVSFFKIGQIEKSKSKIINEVINDGANYFFNWDCDGGTAKQFFVDGMAELYCYFPKGDNDFYSDIIIFTNLRGDAKKHTRQLNFMQKISVMSFVLLMESNLDDEAIELLEKLAKSPGGVVVMLADLKNNQKLKNEKHKQAIEAMPVIKLKGRNYAQIRNEVRKVMVDKLCSRLKGKWYKLSECVDIARSFGIQIDEDETGNQEGKALAESVLQTITLHSAHEVKLKMLPLHGTDLWQKWAALDKESHRQLSRNKTVEGYSKDMETEKNAVRQQQLEKTLNRTPTMKAFLSCLLDNTGRVRKYFLHWLKMLLEDHSQKILPSLNDAYLKTRSDILKAKARNKSQQEDSEIISKLKEKLKLQNEQVVNASIGLKHFFREMGQMYEAIFGMDTQRKRVSRDLKKEVSCFPKVVAELMKEGYPFEIMDGDAAHVPITWVLAVIGNLKEENSKNRNVFVVSVLGIQSSGKSTLLNTTFGLQFNVSAGRCTRGAHFQLLPFNSALRKEVGCDHILIVDTEGLRAPELQYNESQKHDNEIATFVIGLADLTIINIFGETPGELTDILQTAVHAFIRMKNVDMQPSCHFVHQNVSSILAESKNVVGRQTFQDILDKMTSIAAKIEKCEGTYKLFQDVIQFDDETNVTYFPNLWKGDPPMAPVNPGYSFKASTLKQAIMTTAQVNGSHCNFGIFQLRVERLWSAVLQEKFVFSFKNTLEVAAYNELDTKLSQWSWNLQQKVLELQHQAGNQINSCKVSDLDSVFDNCLLEVEKDLNTTYLKLKEELVKLFENIEKTETLAQWRKSTEVRLKNLCDEHKDEARKYCKVLHLNREGRVKVDKIQQTYLQQLQAQVVVLASNAKLASLTAQKREDIFNTQWKKWMEDLSRSDRPVKYASENHMRVEITKILDKIYNAHSQLVMLGLRGKPLPMRGTLKLDIIQLHLSSTKSANKGEITFDRKGGSSTNTEVNEEDFCFARTETADFFHQVKKWMEEILESCQDFSKSQVSDLFMKLKTSVEKFNNGNNSFAFTPHYQVDIALAVAGYVYQQFVEKVKQLAFENDPVELTNTQKELFLRTFETNFSKASNDQTAAQNLANILSKSIEEALTKKVRIEIVSSMKYDSCHYRKKNYFKVLVMKDLAVANNFELYKEYLSNISDSLKYWSKVHVKRHCELKRDNGNSHLFNLAELNLNGIITAITNLIEETSFEVTCVSSSNSDKVLTTAGGSVQCRDVKKWVEAFHENVKNLKLIAIDLQKMMVMVGVSSIHNLNFFTQQLIRNMKLESKKILLGFENTAAIVDKLTKSANSPHNVLFNSLIGCKEQCPFCKEQCELTVENHLIAGKPHYSEIHRPRCLGGYRYSKDKKLVLEVCTKAIESDSTFKNADTKNEHHPYKQYKEIYPNWQISTESPKTGPKYWEWFIATYNNEIVKWNKAEPTSVDSEGWQYIKVDDALDNLSETYGLKIVAAAD